MRVFAFLCLGSLARLTAIPIRDVQFTNIRQTDDPASYECFPSMLDGEAVTVECIVMGLKTWDSEGGGSAGSARTRVRRGAASRSSVRSSWTS